MDVGEEEEVFDIVAARSPVERLHDEGEERQKDEEGTRRILHEGARRRGAIVGDGLAACRLKARLHDRGKWAAVGKPGTLLGIDGGRLHQPGTFRPGTGGTGRTGVGWAGIGPVVADEEIGARRHRQGRGDREKHEARREIEPERRQIPDPPPGEEFAGEESRSEQQGQQGPPEPRIGAGERGARLAQEMRERVDLEIAALAAARAPGARQSGAAVPACRRTEFGFHRGSGVPARRLSTAMAEVAGVTDRARVRPLPDGVFVGIPISSLGFSRLDRERITRLWDNEEVRMRVFATEAPGVVGAAGGRRRPLIASDAVPLFRGRTTVRFQPTRDSSSC